jgi:hypothetical protein
MATLRDSSGWLVWWSTAYVSWKTTDMVIDVVQAIRAKVEAHP